MGELLYGEEDDDRNNDEDEGELQCRCGNRIMEYDGKLYCPQCVNM